MFITLLIVTFIIAIATSSLIAFMFSRPIAKILTRLVSEELAPTWKRYIIYAIYVVGISGGVAIWEIERYITPDKDGKLLILTSDRWVVEIYRSIIGALQSTAWMLLVFFLFTLIGYILVKGFESRKIGEK